MEDRGLEADATARRSDMSAGMDEGLRVLSYLISGVLFYGFLGWVGDHFLGTSFLLPVGIILGAALAIYIIIRRFAVAGDKATTPDPVTTEPAQQQTAEGER